jgi:phosphonate transport system ATP-binding protein
MHPITEGELIVNDVAVDETLKGDKLRKFRREIGMIFQSFNLIMRTSVIKNVLAAKVADMSFIRSFLGLYKEEDKIAALSALEKLGILDKAYTRADQLSGGQQQRVALARTLTQDPKIILADEPVASLDPVTANQVMSDFKTVNKDFNITVIANMHHVDMALNYADRVIGIRQGEIVFDGPSSKITNTILKDVYGREITDDDILAEAPKEIV